MGVRTEGHEQSCEWEPSARRRATVGDAEFARPEGADRQPGANWLKEQLTVWDDGEGQERDGEAADKIGRLQRRDFSWHICVIWR